MNHRRVAVMLIFICLLLLSFRPVKVLSVIDARENSILAVYPIERNQLIEYTFIHSVSLTPVVEGLWVNDDYEFVTTTVRYQDQSGAGLPEQTFAAESFEQDDGWFIMDGLSVSSEKITIHVDKNYENTLKWNDRKVRLYEYFEDRRGIVTVSASNQPYILYIIERMLFA